MKRMMVFAGVLVGMIGILATCIAFFYVYPGVEAHAILRVRRDIEGAPAEYRLSKDEFETYKQTQVDLIHSQFVLNAALRNPRVSRLPWIRGMEDPATELEANLTAKSPDASEVIVVTLSGPDVEQTIKVLDAILESYQNEIITNERQLASETLHKTRERLRRVKEDMKDKLDQLAILQPTSPAQVQNLNTRIAKLNEKLIDLDIEIKTTDEIENAETDPEIVLNRKAIQTMLQDAMTKLTSVNNSNSDSEILRLEIERLNQLAEQLAQKQHEQETVLASRSRVQVLQHAHVPDSQVAAR